jgi:hypothetical protein
VDPVSDGDRIFDFGDARIDRAGVLGAELKCLAGRKRSHASGQLHHKLAATDVHGIARPG